LKIVNFDLRPP